MGAPLHLVSEGGRELRRVLEEQVSRGDAPSVVLLEGAAETSIPPGLSSERLDPAGSVEDARRLLQLLLHASNTAVW